jgi:hypothetical protein
MRFNIPSPLSWILKLFFYRIDFKDKGIYTRESFLFYDTYRENYYYKMDDGWRIHHLSNYGIITVWYFKPN